MKCIIKHQNNSVYSRKNRKSKTKIIIHDCPHSFKFIQKYLFVPERHQGKKYNRDIL